MKNNKRALSEMVAYVILISIALGIAMGVYAWMAIIAKGANETIDCKEGTSVTLEYAGYNDLLDDVYFHIKNNGRFNVGGVIVGIGNDSKKFIPYYLMPVGGGGAGTTRGHFDFNPPLSPGDTNIDVKFPMVPGYSPCDRHIRIVQIQPYIIVRNKKVVCTGTSFRDDTLDIALSASSLCP